MFKFGLREKDAKEVFGQIIRLIFGGWKSFIDHVPIGNTGGANVPPMKRMPIPNDIKILFNRNEKKKINLRGPLTKF